MSRAAAEFAEQHITRNAPRTQQADRPANGQERRIGSLSAAIDGVVQAEERGSVHRHDTQRQKG